MQEFEETHFFRVPAVVVDKSTRNRRPVKGSSIRKMSGQGPLHFPIHPHFKIVTIMTVLNGDDARFETLLFKIAMENTAIWNGCAKIAMVGIAI